jgi:hypothetical protein
LDALSDARYRANIRYVFDSPTKARLQEIGPRFTLKLRWLKKGLPSVTAPDGRIAHGGNDDLDKVLHPLNRDLLFHLLIRNRNMSGNGG